MKKIVKLRIKDKKKIKIYLPIPFLGKDLPGLSDLFESRIISALGCIRINQIHTGNGLNSKYIILEKGKKCYNYKIYEKYREEFELMLCKSIHSQISPIISQ